MSSMDCSMFRTHKCLNWNIVLHVQHPIVCSSLQFACQCTMEIGLCYHVTIVTIYRVVQRYSQDNLFHSQFPLSLTSKPQTSVIVTAFQKHCKISPQPQQPQPPCTTWTMLPVNENVTVPHHTVSLNKQNQPHNQTTWNKAFTSIEQESDDDAANVKA